MTADDVRLIAFYLPQFHPIPENDIWWGQGFTEWTKVAEAKPLFKGHHQPQLPGSLGFYDLRLPEAREAQARLARQHGIHGFCYYHYNFSGQRLLERPFNDVLASGQPDFPFCICWANENWTRRWDGQDHEILIKQNYSPENDRDMIRGLIPALQDPRYIRVKGAPLVLVYRTQLLPDPAATAAIWRAEAAAAGLPSLYLCRVESIGTSNSVGDPGEIGFDSACEFPPNAANVADSSFLATNLDPDFTGLIYDYETVAQDFATRAMPSYRRFHGVMPSWDNTARNGRRAHLAINASPEAYRRWLKTAIERTRREQDGDERLVFINAWNEWGEGCHLEPDRRYGFAWLEATRAAIGRSDGVGISDPPATAENVAALGQRTADLEDLLHAKRQEIKKQESQMSSLASEHAQDIAALRGVIAQRDQDIQHLTAHNQDLSSALTAAAATVTRRDQDIQHLTTHNQDLSSALTAAAATVTRRDQDIQHLTTHNQDLSSALTAAAATVTRRDQDIQHLTTHNQELAAHNQDLSSALTAVTATATQCDEDIQHLTTHNQDLAAHNQDLSNALTAIAATVTQRDEDNQHLTTHNQDLAAHNQDLSNALTAIAATVTQRDEDIQHLTTHNQDLAAHNQDLSNALTAIAATVTQRDQDIQHLTTRNQDLSSALTAVTATVTQRDQDILVLQDVIASLRHDLTEWQAVVEHRDQRLLALYNSTSWKFSAPVRKFGTFVHFLRGLHRNRLYPLALRPLHDLEEDGKRFVSTGEDPAFLLSWLGSVPLAGGWSRISFNVPEASSPLTPVLYFDTGSGFTPQHVLALPSITAGSVDIVTPLPANIKALRLDPMDGPGSFSLTGVEIREIGKIQILWHALRYNKTGIYRGLSYFYRHGWTATKRRIVQDLQWDKMHSDQQHWTTLNNRLTATSLNAFAEKLTRMAHHPRISILMPTYNTPEDVLRKTIQSVLDQIYPVWELCIVDDGSSQEQTKRVLQEYSSRDVRIKVDFAEKNMGVSHASNMALRLATGTFVVLLDHDDLLKEQAIFRVAECVETDNPDMLYSDEVLLSGDGTTVIGHAFRPAFSPELLRSHPYIVHMLGFRRQFLTDIGGFDESLSISQDYDLILRASEKARSIVHIPEILYCWRTDKNSAGHQKMQQVMDISRSVLTRHLERCGENGTVLDGPSFNFFDTRYPLQDNVKVAIIIPTKNHGDLVRQCIQSIEATVHNVRFDIVLIDHASDDVSSVEYFDTLKERIQILRYEGPFNFSAINNFAVAKLNKEYSHYLFCNNDIEAFEDGWLERMVEPGQRPSIGVVGAKLFYPDRRTIQHAGVCVGAMGLAEHFGKFMEMPKQGLEPGYWGSLIVNHEVSAVTAACLLISKEAFEAIDGFDEGLAVGFGDVDLCLKVVEKGYRVLFCPYARLVHHESLTRGKSTEDPHPQDSAYFLRKWKKLLEEGDPYFNPNLSLFHMAWHIKHPRNEELEIRRRVYQPELR